MDGNAGFSFFQIDGEIANSNIRNATASNLLYLGATIGRRTEQADGTIIGFNAALDLFKSDYGNWLPQITLGGEYFNDGLEIRANAYLPLSDDTEAAVGDVVNIGGSLFAVGTGEVAMPGIDFEIGRRWNMGAGSLGIFGG